MYHTYTVTIPGSTVTAYVAKSSGTPGEWFYSLWDGDEIFVGIKRLNLNGLEVTPQQVARIAFILEVEYSDGVHVQD